MLNLNLKNSENITISNKHEVFKGTPFADHEFSLKMKPITQVKYSEVTRKNTQVFKSGATSTNDTGVVSDLFCWSVVEWEGIAADGNALECNQAMKQAIVAQAYALADAAVAACYTVTREQCVARDEAEKN